MAPRTPKNLGTVGRSFWKSVASEYQLRPDELRSLEDACREMDLIDRLEAALVDAELTVKGSQGQPVANPLVQEVRQHRMALKSLLAALKLPDEESQQSRSAQARDAAHARWRRGAA